MNHKNYQIEINEGGGDFYTLQDIIPLEDSSNGQRLKILIVGKRPAPESVRIGHYFQGKATKQGKKIGNGPEMWRQLKEYCIIHVPEGYYEDECLLDQQIGIMDIVKLPSSTGTEPTKDEYIRGKERVMRAIAEHKPEIIIFVYLKGLKKILEIWFHIKNPIANYGFNPELESIFGAWVFVLPLPGVGGVNTSEIQKCMVELAEANRSKMYKNLNK